MKIITFIDTEVAPRSKKITDIGAIKSSGETLHDTSWQAFAAFVRDADFLCGHNIIRHDLAYLRDLQGSSAAYLLPDNSKVIDTLYWSPLLFPKRPYHKLVKDDKLQTDELNNPLNDAKKARDLFYDEDAAFSVLPHQLKQIYYTLLGTLDGFSAFFLYKDFVESVSDVSAAIRSFFKGDFCNNADLVQMVKQHPAALAYCLAIIHKAEEDSITPRWVLHQYPEVDAMLHRLRETPCCDGCDYCRDKLDVRKALKRFFGYDAYRHFDGVSLQEQAVEAAIRNQSLLAVFPTGGGKSITFQVPALLAGKTARGLTVVISPLQSLMKDQVDNLEQNHITDSVAINGLLDPIERAEAFRRVEQGDASILYLSPESLRSKTIERLLMGRRIVRFVIDEAHCFSAWGQDFRVDYLYIADFIRNLYDKKQLQEMIPVSCFTATAKQNVITDIRNYFKENLNLDLELYTAGASRKNLSYKVLEKAESEKYDAVRNLLEYRKCPTIIYVSRIARAEQLTKRLSQDGYQAKAYHGKMDKKLKSENQDLFIQGEIDIMVATSAFGMGVDKNNVGMVIHYDISDSLESYVQEAGRAGRDQSISAECFILFNDNDLNKHFMLLNQTRISIQEIQQVWKAIKDDTKKRPNMSRSALELARAAGWDDAVMDIETRVKTTIAALENAGYIRRGQNMPRVYADSILAKNAMEAIEKIRNSPLLQGKEEEHAIRIIRKMISGRSRKLETEEVFESRVDYISDDLGIEKKQVLQIIQKLRESRVLADAKDLTAYVDDGGSLNRAAAKLGNFIELERLIINEIPEEMTYLNLKELNEHAVAAGIKQAGVNHIRLVMNFWAVKRLISREISPYSRNHIKVILKQTKKQIMAAMETRWDVAEFILQYLDGERDRNETMLTFSVLELKEAYDFERQLLSRTTTTKSVEDALFFLSRMGVLKLEGGFLITYNALSIERLERDNKIRYKIEDYKQLEQYYAQKTQMIHIVGAYARKMAADYQAALEFADDYFQMDYRAFLNKYFDGSRREELQRNLTPDKFKQLFGELSPTQLKIINDRKSQYIVVAAGPGSGKTRILVHKLASLMLMEEVKHEQLLMVTFSRAAATEFKKRLLDLIGNAANFIQIQTFHSYCFDLLGKVGDLEKSADIIEEAVRYVVQGEAEPSKITKTVLVIDEAQDMNEHEFCLIQALMNRNDNMRVIAVGDDDQNIYAFRNSDSRYMKELSNKENSSSYELVENYRSKANLVVFTNLFAELLKNRMKQTPNIPVSKKNGIIRLVHYRSSEFMLSVVRYLKRDMPCGSVCMMTKTNEEAMQMVWLLRRNGFAARLIQSNERYDFFNLQEIRYFIQCLDLAQDTFVIPAAAWERAKADLQSRFAGSADLPVCLRLLQDFEAVNINYKYISDLFIFLHESAEEDFGGEEQDSICVSTIHKSKGREFDQVVIMLKDYEFRSEEEKRTLYVGMTRAREQLTIHYNKDFPGITGDIRYRMIERMSYEEVSGDDAPCNHITLQAGYRDIFLSYFNETQKYLRCLVSGDEIKVDDRGCLDRQGHRILLFSAKFKDDIKSRQEKGYCLKTAFVRHMLYWREEGAEQEIIVMLPEVEMMR